MQTSACGLLYTGARATFVLTLLCGFLFLLARPSVQKFLEGKIMVEVRPVSLASKELSFFVVIFVDIFLFLLVLFYFNDWCQVSVYPEAVNGRPQLQELDAPAVTICAKVLHLKSNKYIFFR